MNNENILKKGGKNNYKNDYRKEVVYEDNMRLVYLIKSLSVYKK